jgi:hypothetical protein
VAIIEKKKKGEERKVLSILSFITFYIKLNTYWKKRGIGKIYLLT